MSRVTRKHLDNMVQRINELRGTDELVLDNQPIYGGYRLSPRYELYKQNKVSILARNCDGRLRVSAREMEAFLAGMLEVLTELKYKRESRYALMFHAYEQREKELAEGGAQ